MHTRYLQQSPRPLLSTTVRFASRWCTVYGLLDMHQSRRTKETPPQRQPRYLVIAGTPLNLPEKSFLLGLNGVVACNVPGQLYTILRRYTWTKVGLFVCRPTGVRANYCFVRALGSRLYTAETYHTRRHCRLTQGKHRNTRSSAEKSVKRRVSRAIRQLFEESRERQESRGETQTCSGASSTASALHA